MVKIFFVTVDFIEQGGEKKKISIRKERRKIESIVEPWSVGEWEWLHALQIRQPFLDATLYISIYIYIYVHIIHINCTKHCIDICVHFGHLFSFLITYGLRPFFSFLLSLVSLLIEARRFNSTRRNTRELIARTTWNLFSNHVLFRLFKDRLMSFSLSDSPLWTLTNRHVKFFV